LVVNWLPIVSISQPQANAKVYKGIPYVVRGTAEDPTDFLPAPMDCKKNLQWTSSKAVDPPFPYADCDKLLSFQSSGPRTLTLTATDSQNQSGSAAVSIQVADPPTSGPPLVVIENPLNGYRLDPQALLSLKGFAFDPEGKPFASYDWTLRYKTNNGWSAKKSLGTSLTPPAWKPSADVPFNCGGRQAEICFAAKDQDSNTGTACTTVQVGFAPC
jgi:hypothetical protein